MNERAYLGKHLRIAQNDHTVLRTSERDVEAAWVVEETDALILVRIFPIRPIVQGTGDNGTGKHADTRWDGYSQGCEDEHLESIYVDGVLYVVVRSQC